MITSFVSESKPIRIRRILMEKQLTQAAGEKGRDVGENKGGGDSAGSGYREEGKWQPKT